MVITGKTVLITGCSEGGIGHALAVAFQQRGLTVFATARNVSKMTTLEKLSNVVLLPLDVTSPKDIAAAVEEVKSRTSGKLDYLVNNSGQQYFMPSLDVDIEAGKKLFDVNFWGVVRMVQAFMPLLIRTKGTVVNIGSVVAYLHAPYHSLYNASKAALHIFDETMRIELAPLNVKVLTVVTGSIESNVMANAPKPELPEGSRYVPAMGYLVKLSKDDIGIQRTKTDVFAEGTVGDILGGKTGFVWRGANSTLIRYLPSILPGSMIDRLMTSGTDLDKVALEASR